MTHKTTPTNLTPSEIYIVILALHLYITTCTEDAMKLANTHPHAVPHILNQAEEASALVERLSGAESVRVG